MHRQQNNSQRKPKSANNVDSGKQKEKVFVRQTNVVHQPEAASTTKQLKHKSANSLVSGNKKENESSDQVYGNQQPNTAPREAAVSMAKNQSSKKTKSANNTDPGKKEEKVFVSHTNGIHQPETAYTAKQSKHKSSANSLVLGNKKENKPSDQVCGDQQPNTAPRVAAVLMAKHQSSKKTKTRSDLGKKQGIYVPKIDLHKRQREDKTDLKGTA